MTTDAAEETDRTAGSDALYLLRQSGCQRAEEIVAAMYDDAERVKRRELAEALDELDARGECGDVRRDVVEGLADAIVDQLLAAPTTSIYEAGDRSTLDTAVQLFELEIEFDETCEDDSYRPEVTGDED